jgi:hypothetical protein
MVESSEIPSKSANLQGIEYIYPQDFPDLGLKVPKGEAKERCVRAIGRCVTELRQPGNFEAFREAAVEMFEAFGVAQTNDEEGREFTENSMRLAYDRWHQEFDSGRAFYVDVEQVTPQDGYVNVYIHYDFDGDGSGRRRVRVTPGGCSEMTPRQSSQRYLPVQRFAANYAKTVDLGHNWLETYPQERGLLGRISQLWG